RPGTRDGHGGPRLTLSWVGGIIRVADAGVRVKGREYRIWQRYFSCHAEPVDQFLWASRQSPAARCEVGRRRPRIKRPPDILGNGNRHRCFLPHPAFPASNLSSFLKLRASCRWCAVSSDIVLAASEE